MNDSTEKSRSKPQKQGVGAQEGSGRWEYRRFRKLTKQTDKIQKETTQPNDSVHSRNLDKVNGPVDSANVDVIENAPSKQLEKKSRQTCRFFRTKNGCQRGDKCGFRHVPRQVKINQKVENEQAIENENVSVEASSTRPIIMPPKISSQRFVPAKTIASIMDSGSELVTKIRKAEINFYKRRFPNAQVMETNELTIIKFILEPSDPEWSFAVREVQITVELPKGFPLEVMSLRVSSDENQTMPDILCAHIEFETKKYIQEIFSMMKLMDAYEGVAKGLLRWIDRSLFHLFLDGLRRTKLVTDASAAGITLFYSGNSKVTDRAVHDVQIENSVKKIQITKIDDSEENIASEEASSSADERNDNHMAVETTEPEIASDPPEMLITQPLNRLPIDVTLNWVDTSKNIASISASTLQIVVRCARCSEHNEIEVQVKDVSIHRRCTRCNVGLSVRMRSELVHENSNVLAQCDTRSCRPIDCILMNSRLKFVCFACNKEDDVQKIGFGESHRSWCRVCHAACNFIVHAIRFQGDFSKTTLKDEQAGKSLPKPKKTIEKNLGIVLGQPLPNLGTCSHYRKSYRWFRFPCCGKVYPCDDCHNEKEKEHEMKLANRMICGHCSAEQPFTKNKPCTSCEHNVTRSRSQFWEGGKGCRDQNMMSRNDAHKHLNSRKKTVSGKKASLLVEKKKNN